MNIVLTRSGCGLLLSTCLMAPALAQQAGTGQAARPVVRESAIEQVVVTAARRRSENVQKTPLAITALNAALLQQNQITNIAGLARLAPNLQISRVSTSGDAAAIYLRGFGVRSNDPANDPHVAVFIDGIYQPATVGSLFDLFDVAQVEVLSGPQGTLLGKNAPVGAIYLTSLPPTDKFGGSVEGDYGSYDHFGFRARINAPLLTDSAGQTILSSKLSFLEETGGNWQEDTYLHKRNFGGDNLKVGRGALAFKPNDAFQWNIVGTFDAQRNPQYADRNENYLGSVPGSVQTVTQGGNFDCALLGFAPCGKVPYGTTQAAYTTANAANLGEIASTASYKITPITVTAVTGYLAYVGRSNSDVAGVPLPLLDAHQDSTNYQQFSQELRLSSNKDGGFDLNGRLDWVLGGYFSHFAYYNTNNFATLIPGLPLGDVALHQTEHGTAGSEAAFAHVIVHVTDKLAATFGMRSSWDQKDHNYSPPFNPQIYHDPSISFHNNSFEAGVSYQIDPHKLAYFRFAQGYETGGYVGFPAFAGGGSSYAPETNNAFELGAKTDWLDQRLRINVALFLNDLSQLQVQSALPIASPPFFVQATTNAGRATVQGFETQIIAVPVEDLTVHVNVGYLDPSYGVYQSTICTNQPGLVGDCHGIPFSFAPKWTVSIGGDYRMDLPANGGSLDFSLNEAYQSGQYISDPPFQLSYQAGYGLLNAGMKYTFPNTKYSAEVYGTNILNRHYELEAINIAGLESHVTDGRPAEWGIRFIANF